VGFELYALREGKKRGKQTVCPPDCSTQKRPSGEWPHPSCCVGGSSFGTCWAMLSSAPRWSCRAPQQLETIWRAEPYPKLAFFLPVFGSSSGNVWALQRLILITWFKWLAPLTLIFLVISLPTFVIKVFIFKSRTSFVYAGAAAAPAFPRMGFFFSALVSRGHALPWKPTSPPASSCLTLFAMEIFNSTGFSVGLKRRTRPFLFPVLEITLFHIFTRDLCAIIAVSYFRRAGFCTAVVLSISQGLLFLLQ